MSNSFSTNLNDLMAKMKTLRFALLSILIFTAALTMVIGVLADNPGERFLFADQGFEDITDPTPGWTEADGSALVGWSVVSGGLNGSSYRLDGVWTTTVHPSHLYAVRQWPTAVSSGVLTVTFTTKSHNETNERGLAVAIGDDPEAMTLLTRNVYIRFADNGQIQYRNPADAMGWTDIIAYTANTTYDIQFVIDVANKTTDIWIDGIQEVSGLGYTNSAAGDPKAVIFNRYTGSSTTPTGTAQVDDVSAVASLCAPTKTWNGGVGDWNTASNWNPSGVPGTTDSVHISSGSAQLSANADIECLHVASGAGLDLSTQNLTVDYVMTNYGRLTQTQTVGTTFTEFFHIQDITGTTKYRGVAIDNASTSLGSTTVSIRAVDTNRGEYCTVTGAGSPVYTERCFEINPTNINVGATVRLWVLDNEQNSVPTTDLTPYRWKAGFGWESLTTVSTTGVDGANYLSAQGTTTAFSDFLLGSSTSPTAVHLNQIGARTSGGDTDTAALLVSVATLAIGLTGIWLKKRKVAPK